MANKPENSPENSAQLGQARQLAHDVFILGFPILLMDAVRRAHPVEPNRILQLPDDSAALAPGLTDEGVRTVRTAAWIDLRDGPVVLHLPHTRGRYFSITLIDAAGEPFASLGSRTGDDGGCDLALAGPQWRGELHGHLKALRATSPSVWAVSRITANSTADRAEAEALAARQCVAPRREGSAIHTPTPLRMLEVPAYAAIQQVMDMTSEMFLHRLNQLAGRTEEAAQSLRTTPVQAHLARLRDVTDAIAAGERSYQAVAQGFADGRGAVEARARLIDDPDGSGWRPAGAPDGADRATPLAAAARAYLDLGGPVREDVLSLVCAVDEAGRDLSGAERYRIHFPRGAAPPVEAFWSLFVSGRSARGEAFGPRRGISDRNDLLLNPDGSLDLMIQQDFPGGASARNWLPAPAGPLILNMRLHWPRSAALEGAWAMPAVERLGSGFARRAENRRQPTGPPPRIPPDDLRPAYSAWR